jgi:hypothetical protein
MPYASQESVATTLTRAELAAPFREGPPDMSPLPKRTREPVIVEGEAISYIDPKSGDVIGIRFVCDDAGGGP